MRIKMRLEQGFVAHVVRSTCGLQHGASHPLQKGFGPLNQTEDTWATPNSSLGLGTLKPGDGALYLLSPNRNTISVSFPQPKPSELRRTRGSVMPEPDTSQDDLLLPFEQSSIPEQSTGLISWAFSGSRPLPLAISFEEPVTVSVS
jgi:hypothetical protein